MTERQDYREINKMLCGLFGLNPAETQRVVLTMECESYPVLEVTAVVRSTRQITEKRFRVTEVVE